MLDGPAGAASDPCSSRARRARGGPVLVNVVSERVALRPAGVARAPAHRALLGHEPLVVLGAPRVPGLVTAGVRPGPQTCFGPRGAVLLGHDGPLWVCDTGHHRVLGWARLPKEDETPA